jgi:hypothetical protein
MPKRIQRKRSKGWKMSEGAIYVGRPTVWGNPFRVDDPEFNTDGSVTHNTCILLYELYIKETIDSITEFDAMQEWIIKPLRGRDLCCWCDENEPCHADVLLRLANA